MTTRAIHTKEKLALLLISSLTIMSVITISPSLPQMVAEYSHVPNVAFLAQLVLTIPAFMIAVFGPITGRLIDRYGRLRILFTSLVLYFVTGTAGYFLKDLFQILLSRILLGVAVGMSMTTVMTLIADYFEGIDRQKFVGLQVAFMSLAGIIFMILAGVLADLDWRLPFLIYSLALPVLACSIAFLREPVAATKNQHPAGKVRAPGITWALFINTMLMWVLFFLIPVQLPFHLKSLEIEQYSLVGTAIAISTAFSALSSFLYSTIKKRVSFLSVFFWGYLFMAAGFGCIWIANTYLWIVAAMMLAGFGMGMMIPNTNMWLMKVVPPQIRGREIGKLTMFWFLGQFVSPVMMSPLLKVLSVSEVFMFAAGFLLLMSGAALILHFTKSGKYAMG